jgi:hypothetical protein
VESHNGIDGDFVRFRYGLPEKIGGWSQLTGSNRTLPGAARAQHLLLQLQVKSMQRSVHHKDYLFIIMVNFMTLLH